MVQPTHDVTDKCGRGQSHYRQFVEAQGGAVEPSPQHVGSGEGQHRGTTTGGGIALELRRNGHSAKGHHAVGSSCPKPSLPDSLDRDEIKRVLEFLQLTSQGSASVEDVSDGLKQLGEWPA